MVNVSTLRLDVGIIGNIISAILFLSPAPTFWGIIKKKSTEEFHPYPYLAAMMNCLMWIFYGLPFVHPDSTLVITINGFGLFMEIIYLTIFFYYTPKPKYRKHIMLFVAAEIVVYAVIIICTLLLAHTTAKRSMIVGIICIVFGSIMYGSPLSNMYQVIKTKMTTYIPFWLCLAGFLNGCCWFIYAFLKTFDYYIAIGNGIGGGLGFIQLCVFAYYRFIGGKKSNDEVKKPGEKSADVQLSEIV